MKQNELNNSFIINLFLLSIVQCQFPSDLIEFKENTPIGAVIYNMDMSKWTFRLLSTSPANQTLQSRESSMLKAMFNLTSDGTLLINTKIDRESLCPLYCSCERCILKLDIMAELAADKSEIKLMERYLLIQDENDNIPFFNQSVYRIVVSEFHPIDSPIQLPCALDSDSDKFSIRNIKLKSLTTNSPFVLQNQSSQCPTLWLTRRLDAESDISFRLQLCAYEINELRHGCTNLNIDILDENNNQPQFLNDQYRFALSENDMSSKDKAIGKVMAKDRDRTDSIRYSINNNNVFKINPITGVLFIKANVSLDREQIERYEFQAEAVDSSGHRGQTRVIIDVLDKNDNAPIIEIIFSSGKVQRQNKTEYFIEIKEDIRLNSQIALIRTSDKDKNENGQLSVSLKILNELNHEMTSDKPFSLISLQKDERSPSYVLTVVRPIDCETDQKYLLVLTARDHGKSPLQTELLIHVSVLDVNDNNPSFDSTIYSFSVNENSPVGTVIGQLHATDNDKSSKPLRYFLQPSKDDSQINDVMFFSINNKTASLYTKAVLDREQQAVYRFEVIVSDQQGRFGYAEIKVIVLDLNDNSPFFSKSEYILAAEENVAYTKPLYKFCANDRDLQANTSYRLYVNNSLINEFLLLNESTGELWLKKPMDRERYEKLNFFINAIDLKNESLYSTASVQLNVIDQNDNAPTIVYPKDNDIICMEMLTIRPNLQQIQLEIKAHDKDRGLNGEDSLVYNAFIQSKSLLKKFRLYTNNSNVFIEPKDDNQTDKKAELAIPIKVEVCDRGRPVSLCTFSHFVILWNYETLVTTKRHLPIIGTSHSNNCERTKIDYLKSIEVQNKRNRKISFILLIALSGFACFLLMVAVLLKKRKKLLSTNYYGFVRGKTRLTKNQRKKICSIDLNGHMNSGRFSTNEQQLLYLSNAITTEV